MELTKNHVEQARITLDQIEKKLPEAQRYEFLADLNVMRQVVAAVAGLFVADALALTLPEWQAKLDEYGKALVRTGDRFHVSARAHMLSYFEPDLQTLDAFAVMVEAYVTKPAEAPPAPAASAPDPAGQGGD